MVGIALTQIAVGQVEHAEPPPGQERAGDDAAELGADDADVVDALGRRRAEGLHHGGGVYARGAAAPTPLPLLACIGPPPAVTGAAPPCLARRERERVCSTASSPAPG